MTGTLILEMQSFRKMLLSILLAVLLDGVVLVLAVRFLPLSGLTGGAVLAVLAYVLYRVFSPVTSVLFSNGGPISVPWELTEELLILRGNNPFGDGQEERVPVKSLRKVYVWPNRDAWGHKFPGCIVNLEAEKDNILLRCLKHGDEAEVQASAESMEAFLHALEQRTGCDLRP